uniref:Uncharacterized protein n=1 Tax=Pipistrellus kuhlii TaxID=59472 RepID=A0A7J7XUZ1_PIPKU|nr:hypothetical protein mPipKuh1_010506 [Pipistrellus kuhlii]
MCSDLYLLDFLLISFIIIVIIIIIIIILSPTSALPWLPRPSFVFVAFYSFECYRFSGASRPASLALVSLGLFFVCVRMCSLPRVSAPRSPPPPKPFLSLCLSCPLSFSGDFVVEKYDPSDCETEPPLQAKDFIMFRNL